MLGLSTVLVASWLLFSTHALGLRLSSNCNLDACDIKAEVNDLNEESVALRERMNSLVKVESSMSELQLRLRVLEDKKEGDEHLTTAVAHVEGSVSGIMTKLETLVVRIEKIEKAIEELQKRVSRREHASDDSILRNTSLNGTNINNPNDDSSSD